MEYTLKIEANELNIIAECMRKTQTTVEQAAAIIAILNKLQAQVTEQEEEKKGSSNIKKV